MGKKTDKEKNIKDKAEKKKRAKDKDKRSKKIKKKFKDSTKAAPLITPRQRLDMIAEAAYFIAEKHGFDPTRSTQDWQEAEREIDILLDSKQDSGG
jgi:hypothetical protein